MIGMSRINEIIRLSIATGYLLDEKIVSSLIVADPESCKTEVLKQFAKYENTYMVGDLNTASLVETIIPEILAESPRKTTHLIIPDFLKVVQKKSTTANSVMNLLNQLTEEGIYRLPFWNKVYDFKGIQLGLITAMTSGVISDKRRNFHKTGFFSRVIPISYNYSDETYQKIINHIVTTEYLDAPEHAPVNDCLAHLKPTRIYSSALLFQQFNPIIKMHRELERTYGFRFLKHLQRLACANALLHNRNKVNQEDIDTIIRLSEYMNLNYNEI